MQLFAVTESNPLAPIQNGGSGLWQKAVKWCQIRVLCCLCSLGISYLSGRCCPTGRNCARLILWCSGCSNQCLASLCFAHGNKIYLNNPNPRRGAQGPGRQSYCFFILFSCCNFLVSQRNFISLAFTHLMPQGIAGNFPGRSAANSVHAVSLCFS